jgi:hypothetical protein
VLLHAAPLLLLLLLTEAERSEDVARMAGRLHVAMMWRKGGKNI